MAETFRANYGQSREPHFQTEFSARFFMIDQLIRRISTVQIVQINSCTKTSDVDTIGFCDATPMVNMLDGANSVFAHGPVRNLCYFRIHSGKRAIIMDPKAGDIGIAAICDRDIQPVKKNLKASQPGSRRRFDLADGVFFGSVLSKDVPNLFLQMKDDLIVACNATKHTTEPLETVVGDDWVQIKQKVPAGDMHVTIDVKTGLITSGKAIGIAPDPYPTY